MKQRTTRITRILLLLSIILILLTGCSTTNLADRTANPPDPNNGIWDAFFVYPLYWLLDQSAGLLWGLYGLAILVVTLIVRAAVLPLTIKQLKSSKMMQALQPELAKIKEKFKDNPQKQQEETMKLFQKNNVNPLAGCLPLLVQMPILIAFYSAISRSPHIAESAFLWLPNLGSPDPFYILPILAAVTTYFQSKMMMVSTASNPQMKMMTTIMPFFILFISITLPSALSLYWVYGNLFSVAQTYFLKDIKVASTQEGASK